MSNFLNNRKLIFYDFEVLSNCKMPNGTSYWSVVFIEKESNKGKIIKNNVEELVNFFNANKNNIFIGYNSRGYDQWIFKGLMLGMDAGYITKQIIEKDIKGHNVVKDSYKIKLLNYDCATGFHSLKQLEAFMGSMIKESDIPFDIDRPLTINEEKELLKYNIHDVQETIKVFDKLRNRFDAQVGLIDMFNLQEDMISKTSAQLTAKILEAKKVEGLNDEFDFIYPDTLKLNKYTEVKEFFDSIKNGTFKATKFVKDKPKIEIELDIANVPTVYALGGLHGATKNLVYEGLIYSLDVASLYPALILEYGLMSRACVSDEKFRYIRDERIKLKKAKNPLQEALKLAINTVYGTFGDQYNPLCDKRMMRSVCVAGQLLLTDFIEKIEPYCTLFNLNTDGVFFYIDEVSKLDSIMEAVEEWQNRTRLVLELEEYKKVIQKDVNNYIVTPHGELYTEEGKARFKAKGAFVKELSDIDNDLPIVNEAVKMYFLKGTSAEETINSCDELIHFQKVVKVTSAYDEGAWKNCTFSKQPVLNETTGKTTKKMMWDEGSGVRLKDKTFRVFASTREEDGGLFKKKSNMNPAKFPNTSEKVFIDNDDVRGKEVPDYLDRQYYIDLANDRIRQFLGKKKDSKKKESIKVKELDWEEKPLDVLKNA